MSSYAFECNETPLKLSTLGSDSECKSCTLRLTAPLPGDGTVSPDPLGLNVNENPTVTLAENGLQYNLRTATLSFPGAHMLPGETAVPNAELLLSFMSVHDGVSTIVLCIPVKQGIGETNRYFATLGRNPLSNRPTLQTLLRNDVDVPLVQYTGPTLVGRTKNSPPPDAVCAKLVKYYVYTSAVFITERDYARLKAIAGSPAGPAIPSTEVTPQRYRDLCKIVKSITYNDPAPYKSSDGGVNVAAMKCYRLDPDKDIRDGKVYVGGDDSTGLQTELAEGEAADTSATLDMKPGQTQKWVGIVLGVLLGLAVVFVLIAFIWGIGFSGFNEKGTVVEQIVDFTQQSTHLLPRIFSSAPCPPATAAAATAAGAVAGAAASAVGK